MLNKEASYLSEQNKFNGRLYGYGKQVNIYIKKQQTEEKTIKFSIDDCQQGSTIKTIVTPYYSDGDHQYYVFCGSGLPKCQKFCQLVLSKVEPFMFYFEFVQQGQLIQQQFNENHQEAHNISDEQRAEIQNQINAFENYSIHLTMTKSDECFAFLPDFFKQTNRKLEKNQEISLFKDSKLISCSYVGVKGTDKIFKIEDKKIQTQTYCEQDIPVEEFQKLIQQLVYQQNTDSFQVVNDIEGFDIKNFLYKLSSDKRYPIKIKDEIQIYKKNTLQLDDRELYYLCVEEVQL